MTNETPLSFSPSAARRVAHIMAQENNPRLNLRLAVSGGGCSGFQYGFSLDDSVTPDDIVIERDGVKLVVDTISLEYLRGSEVDFVESLNGAFFQVKNPNAASSCGCGSSFAM